MMLEFIFGSKCIEMIKVLVQILYLLAYKMYFIFSLPNYHTDTIYLKFLSTIKLVEGSLLYMLANILVNKLVKILRKRERKSLILINLSLGWEKAYNEMFLNEKLTSTY